MVIDFLFTAPREVKLENVNVVTPDITFLYTAAMMAVRTFIPSTKQRWKYCCRNRDCRSATKSSSTAYIYPSHVNLEVS